MPSNNIPFRVRLGIHIDSISVSDMDNINLMVMNFH